MNRTLTALAVATLLASPLALAKLDAKDAARLGVDLTPTGAEKAGNADGSIPAWNGGLTQPPAGFKAGGNYADPYANEKPLFTVTAANMAEHAALLSPGQKALLTTFNDYKLPVYPSHRTMALPEAAYAATRQQSQTADLLANGNGLQGYSGAGTPFPIPKDGLQALWNHLARYRGNGWETSYAEFAVQANGSFTPLIRRQKLAPAGAVSDSEPNRLLYYITYLTAPESVAGSATLVHEPLDQVKERRLAWTYNPGQRRVLRAPEIAYDNPQQNFDGLRTTDMLDMYNGAPDRYDWTLVGKREMLIPYNTYKFHDHSLKYADIVRPGHLNQDLMRYERHRVWVVEAKLKAGERHIYSKRTFYLDEDSWAIVAADVYDGRGELWRVQEAQPIQFYDVALPYAPSEVSYDLQSRRYGVVGLRNQEAGYNFSAPSQLMDFSANALRRMGR
ncbi:DUF1329 domain-containing protein [Pseudomonas baetica]|uniref:DUF1329 domain-containing protein n=1 Tax=Pseudomonas baetica TaxID=674054 RepID=UPI003EED84B6